MIIRILFWMLIGFIDGTIIYWWIINPINLRKENIKMFTFLQAVYPWCDFTQRENESLQEYNLRLFGYCCCRDLLRMMKEGEEEDVCKTF